jgi:basic amino acid/polyamine antiporter, APA family
VSAPVCERVFGIVPSTSFVVGTVVGTGIYLKPALVAGLLDQAWQVYFVWFLGGFFATCGALTYIQLAKNWPANGGPFIYLRCTYGPWAASLLLAADIFLARPAAVGALATGLGLVWGLSAGPGLGLAISAVLGLSAIQLLGARTQGWSQTVLTLLQLLPLVVILAAFPFLSSELEPPNWSPSNDRVQWGAAFLAVLWAYDGWYNITILGGEVRRPERTLKWALAGGMTFVTGLYLLLNILLCQQLGRQRLTEEGIGFLLLLSDWNLTWLGTATQLALTLAMLATLNGTLACGARMIVAGAREGLLSSSVGVEPTSIRPTLSFTLWCSGLLLLFSGLPLQRNLFDSLTEFTAVVVAVLSTLTVTCIFHGRLFARKPSKVALVAACFYLLIALILLLLLVMESHWLALAGVLTVGAVGTFLWARRQTVPFPSRAD